ncbi:hypothetical protein N8E89_19610 (plasmid) [Phyllobacterium sp. A18/5-2]|uniref:hypothetical protein n=1 Tax=Phyllobacterium sp. A18/5-2 TaxID=2978392 RepID=UPI0021C81862|nr:hypothetical protein [Phyllobacterium sp. A18/5-2]UXN66805.1 hypothetical protein N8E89_19610 [Phyllobacterium sp. A18/5-2]
MIGYIEPADLNHVAIARVKVDDVIPRHPISGRDYVVTHVTLNSVIATPVVSSSRSTSRK